MPDQKKNMQIKNSMKETRKRRSSMLCKVFECKVVSNKLNQKQKEQINQYFREAKWMRNYCVADVNDNARRNAHAVEIKVGDHFETRELQVLGSQVRQDIFDGVKANLKTLSSLKEKGRKVGALTFKSYCNSIPLRQFGTTYRIDGNYIKVQNITKPLYVRGMKQIPDNAEFANAKLVRKPSGLYFHITCYVPKTDDHHRTAGDIGIDLGIEHNLTLSNGDTFDIQVPEDKNIKRLSKKMNRAFHRNGEKKTKNHYKRVNALRRAYERNTNKRQDVANKVCHTLLYDYDFIGIQDEMIHNWHAGLFGKQVQYSAMGAIKARLKNSPKVFMVKRSFPSTQMCPVCGRLTKHPLKKRSYDCPYCGYHHISRDQKSAQSILDYARRRALQS